MMEEDDDSMDILLLYSSADQLLSHAIARVYQQQPHSCLGSQYVTAEQAAKLAMELDIRHREGAGILARGHTLASLHDSVAELRRWWKTAAGRSRLATKCPRARTTECDGLLASLLAKRSWSPIFGDQCGRFHTRVH